LVQQTGLSVLLSELYEDMVITLHEEAGKGMGALHFGRGCAMPLWQGATGRIIMGHLPPRPLRRAYDRLSIAGARNAGLPEWRQFSREMQALRKQGYCLTRGEVEAGRAGVAAPIFDEARRVLGSITLVGDAQRFEMFNEPHLARLVCAAAASLTERIQVPSQNIAPAPGPLAKKKAALSRSQTLLKR
jgi:DNA-binding IclR family transcriptional regulator